MTIGDIGLQTCWCWGQVVRLSTFCKSILIP